MTDLPAPLHALADAAGLARSWRDVTGADQRPSDEVLAAVLAALGHAVDSEAQIARSLAALAREQAQLPALLVADAGDRIALPRPYRRAAVTASDGTAQALAVVDGVPRAPDLPGYYDLELDGVATRLAVAPPHCPHPPHRAAQRPWGAAVQIAALKERAGQAFGDFGDLARAAEALAARGADALAINPVHALFPGYGERYSPYSPSSRLFLNGALGDPALAGLPPLQPVSGLHAGGPIDWPAALPARLAQLRAAFAALPPEQRNRIDLATDGDPALARHATFDALDCHFRPRGAHGWQDWPAAYRDPANAAVARFAAENAGEVAFHRFVQWLARASLAAVQQRARGAGMATGLIGDLAVGVDPGGSDSWAMPQAMLRDLTVGAPPDPLGPHGQDWGITHFSPHGLRAAGYAPWLAMLRAAFAHCGGIRIDHAFGLARLWVIPAGGGPRDGAYLTYPFADLVRLATLEAHLAGAFVIAEDLGTAPHGFTAAITARRMLGLRVLWFERAADHGFIGAHDYPALAVAMTGTHDTPTVAGWWRGRDLDWAARLGRLPTGVDRDQAEAIRDWDRGLLWSTIAARGGAVHGERPAPDNPVPVVRAAIDHVLATPAALAVIPLEDLLGETEQVNLPGTVGEHPNWQRRLAAPLADLLDGSGAPGEAAAASGWMPRKDSNLD